MNLVIRILSTEVFSIRTGEPSPEPAKVPQGAPDALSTAVEYRAGFDMPPNSIIPPLSPDPDLIGDWEGGRGGARRIKQAREACYRELGKFSND